MVHRILEKFLVLVAMCGWGNVAILLQKPICEGSVVIERPKFDADVRERK
jgi:hypothetical protein